MNTKSGGLSSCGMLPRSRDIYCQRQSATREGPCSHEDTCVPLLELNVCSCESECLASGSKLSQPWVWGCVLQPYGRQRPSSSKGRLTEKSEP